MDFINPVSRENMQAVENGLRLLNHAELIMDKACAAGINCDEQRAKSKAIRQVLEGIRREFGPGAK